MVITCGMVWSVLGIGPCKTGLISEPPQFLWQYCTHDITVAWTQQQDEHLTLSDINGQVICDGDERSI